MSVKETSSSLKLCRRGSDVNTARVSVGRRISVTTLLHSGTDTCTHRVCRRPQQHRFVAVSFASISLQELIVVVLLGSKLLTELCRTDDMLPSIPISCLPPCCTDPKVLRLNIFIICSQPGGSWSSSGSPICWWF